MIQDLQPTLANNSTIESCIQWVHDHLKQADLFYGHGSDNAWDEAVFLVMSALKMPIQGDTNKLQQIVTAEQALQIKEWTENRISTRNPLPYITSKAYFCGLEFDVNKDVLIPRSPIAEMIGTAFQPWLADEPANILDLCTGCGCIAIACAYAFPNATVDATDLSQEALQMAAVNRLKHGLETRLRLFQGDLFTALPEPKPQYDLIVSNPPYVDAEDMSDLPDEFKREPEMALAAGKDGLDLVRIILAQASDYLTDNGVLVIEVGNSAAALELAFPKIAFTWVEFEYGGHGVFVLDKGQLAVL
jgi:ribosomal protein L3 glutamine methyltransferase